MDCKSSQFFKLLLSDNEIRFYRDEQLKNILGKKSEFIQSLKKSHDFNQRVMHHSDQSRRIYELEKIKQLEIANSLLTIAQDYINYTHIYGTYDKDKKEITILLDAFSPIRIASKINTIQTKSIFGIEFNEKLKLNYRIQTFKVQDEKFKPKDLIFINELTKDTIKKHIHFNKIDSKDAPETRNTEQMLKDNKIQYNLEGNNLFILPKTYTITSNIVISSKYTTTISKGTTFEIGNNINFILKGNTVISGSKENPVVMKQLHPSFPFGCVSILGDNSESVAKIDYLNVSGGSECMYQGRLYTGQFNIFNSTVSINHSTFTNSFGDDGLNVKFSKVTLENCILSNNKADQIDLDFCKAYVYNCQFISSSKDSNGDGLDLSGTKGEIEKCTFKNFLDKSLSLGEKSTVLVHDCTFIKNKNAIAVKDQTTLYSWGNKFENNQFDYYSFIKKGIFNEPFLYINENPKKLKMKLSKKENLLFLNNKLIDFERKKINASFKKFTI
jgi:hypothetical protein